LMNSPAIFQTIMNELLRDLINTRNIESFIDDVIIETESEERYKKLVEKILRRMKENDLHVKLEKCKWKIREMDFLEVVIKLKEIKMKEEKMKVVLDWLVPKLVKKIQKFLEAS